MKHKMIPVRR